MKRTGSEGREEEICWSCLHPPLATAPSSSSLKSCLPPKLRKGHSQREGCCRRRLKALRSDLGLQLVREQSICSGLSNSFNVFMHELLIHSKILPDSATLSDGQCLCIWDCPSLTLNSQRLRDTLASRHTCRLVIQREAVFAWRTVTSS